MGVTVVVTHIPVHILDFSFRTVSTYIREGEQKPKNHIISGDLKKGTANR